MSALIQTAIAMASQRATPPFPGFVPELSLSKKEFQLICREDAQVVANPADYGILSYRLKKKIYVPVLNYRQGGDHTVPGRVHKYIIEHVSHLKLNKVAYIMIATSVATMVDSVETLAKHLADSFGRTIHVHRAPNGNLRIGELKDNVDEQSVAGYAFVTEAYPHPDLIRNGLYFGDDEADPDFDADATATPSNIDAYAHLKHTSGASGAHGKKRRAKKNEIPKPQNAWVLYLNDNYHMVKAQNPHLRTTEISKIIAGMWKDAKLTATGGYYDGLAKQVKADHIALYGDYKVKPRKSSEIKRRKMKKTTTVISLHADLSPADTYGIDIDTSEFQEDRFNLAFDPECYGLFGGQEHLAIVNHPANLATRMEATQLSQAGENALTMSNQVTSAFISGPDHSLNIQGAFYSSGPAVDLSTNQFADTGYPMNINNGGVNDAFGLTDGLADSVPFNYHFNDYASHPIASAEQLHFWEFASDMNTH